MKHTHTTTAIAVLALTAFCCTAGISRTPQPVRAVGTIAVTHWPYLPGSAIRIHVDGFAPPYQTALIGQGALFDGGLYEIPNSAVPGSATLVAGNAYGLAQRTLSITSPPDPNRAMLAVVSYDDGIVFHDATDFSVLGLLATGGTPSDAAIDASGRIATTDTQGTAITIATLRPWHVSRAEGAPLGDEIAIDETTHAIFVTDRDVGGAGALTRIMPDGTVSHVTTGETAEGLAIDEQRQIVYVANVNDGSVAAVDARSMRIVKRFPTVARVFSLALSPDGGRLFAISNQSAGSLFSAPGSAIVVALDGPRPRIVARSGDLTFPLGVTLDATTKTLFVTDEALDVVDVLDAHTLRAKHAPLVTCRTPWQPALDATTQRLYVPCARANQVDVFDARTLRRVHGAPFATGSYPLAVTVWHPPSTSNTNTPQ